MSLDLWLESKTCPTCEHKEVTESRNYTYNVAKMWYEIFPKDPHMVYVDGMTGKESLIKLHHALLTMYLDPETFKRLNPENEWGCYDTFMKYLKSLILDAQEYPNWVWKSCR